MPEISFNVYCGKCGAGLCRNTDVRGNDVIVDACQYCLDEAYDNGYNEGYDKGYETAEQEA